jgi:hypothetical protein
MRRVLLGGVIGALPGGLMILVVFVLERTGAISSDASQVGFIGLPILFLGALIGVVTGVSGSPHAGKAGLGALLGVVAGIAAGIGIDEALHAAGIGVVGLWLILGPAGMIGGAALGVWWGERRSGSPSPSEPGTA